MMQVLSIFSDTHGKHAISSGFMTKITGTRKRN